MISHSKNLFLFLLVFILTAMGQAVCAQYICTTNAGVLTIVGYTGTGGAVAIPGTINQMTVTAIGANAFYFCTNLTSVTLPPTIISIGQNAFYDCNSLTTAFISSNVSTIGSQAFFACPNLAAITVDANNPYYGSSSGILFDYTQTALILYPPAQSQQNYSIPASVTQIEAWAFYNCANLTNVTLSAGITNIGQGAFYNCPVLTAIYVPASVRSIGQSAFAACFDLAAITVDPQNVTYSSQNGVLFNAAQSTLLEYPGGKVGNYAIPATVSNIADNAFLYSVNLSGVLIPQSVTAIGFFAFEDCTALRTLTIPASVTNIGLDAFFYCTNLSSVYFSGNAPTTVSFIFYANNNATVYYLPGTSGWGSTFAGLPALLWNPTIQASGTNFGVRAGQFGFNITGTANIPVLVESCSNLSRPSWFPQITAKLTNGLFYFTEPIQSNGSSGYYRLRSP